jgi:hypothetical protein
MKLRLHENSIRVRLNRTEVAQFAQAGRVEDAIDFGDGALLAYVVEASADAQAPRATFLSSVIRIELPAKDVEQWARTDRVGISGERILVEKDFECLHDASETDPDAFPNPNAAHH